MKIMYKADTWIGYKVTEKVITKETDKSVWFFRGNVELCELKETNNHKYFENKEDAERHIRDFLLEEIRRAESRVQYWREKLDKLNRGG